MALAIEPWLNDPAGGVCRSFSDSGRPDGWRPDVAGENGVFIGKMADLLRQILRVNGFVAGLRQIVEPFRASR
jgi:hypothetical protein